MQCKKKESLKEERRESGGKPASADLPENQLSSSHWFCEFHNHLQIEISGANFTLKVKTHLNTQPNLIYYTEIFRTL